MIGDIYELPAGDGAIVRIEEVGPFEGRKGEKPADYSDYTYRMPADDFETVIAVILSEVGDDTPEAFMAELWMRTHAINTSDEAYTYTCTEAIEYLQENAGLAKVE